MSDLFLDGEGGCSLALPDSDIRLYPAFMDKQQADALFQRLRQDIPWTQYHIRLYGREYAVPRLSAWYADEGRSYEYSGLQMKGLPWSPALMEIKESVEIICGAVFNSMLANLYRHGADSVGWHADDEPELGSCPLIASLSLGEERSFQLKHRHDKTLKKTLLLPHGSLLIMAGRTQHCWLHQIPKSRRPMQPRINLTFRQLKENAG